MFVWKSTHRELQRKHRDLDYQHQMLNLQFNQLMGQWNDLVRKVNRSGGQAFLDGRKQVTLQFSPEEIKKLLVLCHPDKHDGKDMAVKMTQKLLELRK